MSFWYSPRRRALPAPLFQVCDDEDFRFFEFCQQADARRLAIRMVGGISAHTGVSSRMAAVFVASIWSTYRGLGSGLSLNTHLGTMESPDGAP